MCNHNLYWEYSDNSHISVIYNNKNFANFEILNDQDLTYFKKWFNNFSSDIKENRINSIDIFKNLPDGKVIP
jgi:hypothetical protein